jgi:hypothetical protein
MVYNKCSPLQQKQSFHWPCHRQDSHKGKPHNSVGFNAWQGWRWISLRKVMAASWYWIKACKSENRVQKTLTFHWSTSITDSQEGKLQTWNKKGGGEKNYNTLKRDLFSLPLCLHFGVPMWFICKSDISERGLIAVRYGNWVAQLFCVPEWDQDWYDFLSGDFWQMLQDCWTLYAGGWYACIFTPGMAGVGRFSVWVETLDWEHTVLQGGVLCWISWCVALVG